MEEIRNKLIEIGTFGFNKNLIPEGKSNRKVVKSIKYEQAEYIHADWY